MVDCRLGVRQSGGENVRLNVIHISGVDEMSTQHVFHYFAEFAPTAIEWIDDSSCMSLCLSVCPSVCPSVRLSVRPSVQKTPLLSV